MMLKKYPHAIYLTGWIIYFGMFFVTENLIPIEKCHPIHCFLDDIIPFNEYFVIFYVGWYVLVGGAVAYTFFKDVEAFKKLQIFITVTQVIGMLCYIIYPSRQDLRPDVFPRENIFTHIMAFIYDFDTNTGVCPSMHVAFSLGVLSVALKSSRLKKYSKVLVTIFVICVCLAVCFVKQHSVVDVIAAIPVCIVAELFAYGKDYRKARTIHEKIWRQKRCEAVKKD